jgi:hypothetical protein
MNVNSQRLDDRFNSLVIAAAIALVVGLNIDVFGGATLGRGAESPKLAQAKPAAPTVSSTLLVAAR